MTIIVKIMWLVNNLRNIHMSANCPKKKYFKNKLLDLDKCFYDQHCSYNQTHKLTILSISKKI